MQVTGLASIMYRTNTLFFQYVEHRLPNILQEKCKLKLVFNHLRMLMHYPFLLKQSNVFQLLSCLVIIFRFQHTSF